MIEHTYPSLVRRYTSTLVDFIVIVIFFGLISKIFNTNNSSDGTVRGIMFFALLLLYEPLLISIAFTPGQFITKIRVVKFKNSGKVNFLKALLRYIFKIVFGIYSFIICMFVPGKRAFHDIVAGTVVVDYPFMEAEETQETEDES